jgi:hypothetical protein
MAEDEDANIISRIERKKAHPEKEGSSMTDSYSKYTVGGESKEVPAPGLDKNDNFVHRREQNAPERKGHKR